VFYTDNVCHWETAGEAVWGTSGVGKEGLGCHCACVYHFISNRGNNYGSSRFKKPNQNVEEPEAIKEWRKV
jgi:hypothetical protein